MTPCASLVEYERHGELECCMAECDRKKRTLCGEREEGRQGCVERHVWQATLEVNVGYLCTVQDWIVCMYFPLAIVCICVYYVPSCCMTVVLPSLEGGIIKGII